MLAPLTGGAGFLGQEQLSWARLAIKTLPKTMGLKVKLVPGDAPAEQGPSAAQTVAQKFVANKTMVGVIGGSTSGSVAATSKTFNAAGMVQISSSATRTTLTKGDNQEATKSFFRVVPADDFQGPTDAKYMIDVLKVKNVAIIDFQEPYSQGLAGEVEKALKDAGVTTSRQSIDNKVTDFSYFVTKVPTDADIVFFPSQKPGDAQAFAQQLAEQGKKAKVFGGDGVNGPGASRRPAPSSRTSPRRSTRSPPTRRSSRPGRRTTPARPSAPSARRPTAPCRSCCWRSRPPATRARARSPSAER